ncbi:MULTISPECIES: holo-ACP synthase [unclassified Kribbella]|uniref:holo-ACP synthase n=1 Tax=unclassified Kribbella TaxID=2644121 RepID=UPI00307845F7
MSAPICVCVLEVSTDACAWHELLSPAELAYCAGLARVGEHLAARVAAKHAIVEALRWPGPVPWREIEILRTPSRAPEVLLTGSIERWCRQSNLLVPRVSLTHAAGYAAALAWLPGPRDEAAA